MADEVKKYLDYEGLKHLVEQLTNRIEAVGGDYLPLTGGTVTGALTVKKGLTVSGDTDLQGVTTVSELSIGDGSRALVEEGGSLVVNPEASVNMKEGARVDVAADVYMDLARLSDPSTGTALFLNGGGKVVEVTLDALKGALGASEQSYTRVTQTAYIWLAAEYDDGGGDNWSYLTIQSNESWTLTYDGSASGWLFFGDEGDPFEGTWNGSRERTFTIWPKSRNTTGSPRRAEIRLTGATSGQVTVVSVVQLA